MIFLFGEKLRVNSSPIGERDCPVCKQEQPFTEQRETVWFSLFMIPILPIEETARYWRCENCQQAFEPDHLEAPSQAAVTKRVIVYLLMGYGHANEAELADEISQKIIGLALPGSEFRDIARAIAASNHELVEHIRRDAPSLNTSGKQQVLEAAFLTTYLCCDMEYEDRLRINLMGNAMGVGLEFVDYCIEQVRRMKYYGVHRLSHSGTV